MNGPLEHCRKLNKVTFSAIVAFTLTFYVISNNYVEIRLHFAEDQVRFQFSHNDLTRAAYAWIFNNFTMNKNRQHIAQWLYTNKVQKISKANYLVPISFQKCFAFRA